MTDEMMAYCGLVCTECPAYQGTQADDRALLESTARRWSEGYGESIAPEDILCDGCRSETGRRARFCDECGVRACCIGRGMETCARCEEYICERLETVLGYAPEARANLEELRGAG